MRSNRSLLTYRDSFALFVSTDEKKKHGKSREKGWRDRIKDRPDDEPHKKRDDAPSLPNPGSRGQSFAHRFDQEGKPLPCIRQTRRDHLQSLVIRIFWNWMGN